MTASLIDIAYASSMQVVIRKEGARGLKGHSSKQLPEAADRLGKMPRAGRLTALDSMIHGACSSAFKRSSCIRFNRIPLDSKLISIEGGW